MRYYKKIIYFLIFVVLFVHKKQCEGSCVRGIKSAPTSIGKLEKEVNEWAIKNSYQYKIEKKKSNGQQRSANQG